MTEIQRFSLDDEAGFQAYLARVRRVVVLAYGVGCPYSSRFEPEFRETPAPFGWATAIREVEEGGRGPVAEGLAVEVTPTVLAFQQGKPVDRLDGKLLIGITRNAYREWVRKLPRAM